MNRKLSFTHLSALALALFYGFVTTSALAGDFEDEEQGLILEEDAFRTGGSCAALAYLGNEQIKRYTSSAFANEFAAYCYPEEPFDCTDYTSFLRGLGQFTTGEDGYYCRFLPQL